MPVATWLPDVCSSETDIICSTGQVRNVPEGDLRRPFQTLVDFSTQQAKVDRLGEQSGCPEFSRPLDGRIVPVGGDHDDGNARTLLP